MFHLFVLHCFPLNHPCSLHIHCLKLHPSQLFTDSSFWVFKITRSNLAETVMKLVGGWETNARCHLCSLSLCQSSIARFLTSDRFLSSNLLHLLIYIRLFVVCDRPNVQTLQVCECTWHIVCMLLCVHMSSRLGFG